ncbi:MAG: tryptophan synthase subunit alpha [Candidatus Marinimicrobia bacterium]|nr:tryptophan synthase subunit alpha [Candidatus Neomarinimicrobiota bacterium]
MNQALNTLIREKKATGDTLLSIYITAGYPHLHDTPQIIIELDKAGVDFVELGIPFSDPMADGPVIQEASQTALLNGFRISHTFEILKEVRQVSSIPILLMTYLNPVHRYGIDTFLQQASLWGANGLIIPDLPLEESRPLHPLLEKFNLDLVHLLPPNASSERIQAIDRTSTSFIYTVAYKGVTGKKSRHDAEIQTFLKSLKQSLQHPFLVGFGIRSREDIAFYTQYADGVIIGTAFIKHLEKTPSEKLPQKIRDFIQSLTLFS